ncbi:MAG: hypothetical protein IIC49_04850 [Planctomycetes bacterium]|nr:hypothetical protein [Planctomycetota bacterium]
MLKLKPHQRRKRHSRALEVLILRHPPLPLAVARGADPERYPVVAVAKLLWHNNPQISLTHYIRPDDRGKVDAVATIALAVGNGPPARWTTSPPSRCHPA